MTRAVLDTNVLVSALLNLTDSPASQIYTSFTHKGFLLLTSKSILAEVERLINQDRIVNRYQLSAQRRKVFFDNVLRLSRLVPLRMSLAGSSIDPDDNKFLVCAMQGKAEFVVSGDHHLLDMGNFHKIKIVTPRSFLMIIKGHDKI